MVWLLVIKKVMILLNDDGEYEEKPLLVSLYYNTKYRLI